MQSSSAEKCIDDDGPSLTEDFSKKLGFQEEEPVEEVEGDEDQEDDDEEFSFAYVNAEGSPITAEEAFEDGHIRPAYPLFNRDLLFDHQNQNDRVSATDDNNSETVRSRRLRKLFVEDRDGENAEEGSLGPYCSWSGGTVEEASPEETSCRKSNSTGFSKVWRFRDLVLRSNSDGRDAFVFFNKTQSSSSSSSAAAGKLRSEDDLKKPMEAENKSTKGKEKTTSSTTEKRTKSAHEKLYMRNRAMTEEGKRRSYLPYKQVGFFTNVSGLTRNIHPF